MRAQNCIAVVDDDESVCRALTRMLRYAGLDARGYVSADAFLSALRDGGTWPAPDCVLIDVQMPGTTGLALHRELLRQGRSLPVIFMTAHDTDGVREEALRQGAKAYLTKPLAEALLLQTIAAATASGDRHNGASTGHPDAIAAPEPTSPRRES